MSEPIVDDLLRSPEPSLRWKVRTRVLGESPTSVAIRRLRGEIKWSPRVGALLARRAPDGTIPVPGQPYTKWQGAHWVLATLAELGYPAGDKALEPLVEQVTAALLRPAHFRDRLVNGRHRRCGSIQGYGLFAAARLELCPDRAGELAALLQRWQWPEGGWNCDPNPNASSPSFMETLIRCVRWPRPATRPRPSTGRHRCSSTAGCSDVGRPARSFAATSSHCTTRSTGTTTRSPDWSAWPRRGRLGDPRRAEALDLLESKRLPDGGWPAEARYYRAVAGRSAQVAPTWTGEESTGAVPTRG